MIIILPVLIAILRLASCQRSVSIKLGDLTAATYSFAVDIKNGSLTEMTIADTRGIRYATTAPGWRWGVAVYPQEMSFKVRNQASGVVFSAKTKSADLALAYNLKTAGKKAQSTADPLPRGYIASFNKTSTRTPKLDLGNLAAGTYSFGVDIQSGKLREMAIVDAAGKVYASTYPGWGWAVANYPQEMSFRLLQGTTGVRFVAVTASTDFAMAFWLERES